MFQINSEVLTPNILARRRVYCYTAKLEPNWRVTINWFPLSVQEGPLGMEFIKLGRRIDVGSCCYSVQNWYLPFTLQDAGNQDIQDS
jgi:hypothetical protein